jgi:starvation-inducible DNA-binding protein
MTTIQDYVQEATTAAGADAPSNLISQLRQVMADNFVFYFKAHSFHWNVEGPNFPQYHKFLKGVYKNAFDAVDRIAEEIRALGEYAPMSLNEMLNTSSLMENTSQRNAMIMFSILSEDNQNILGSILATQKMAEAANQVGLANYLQDLYDSHKKLAWMLSAIQK